MSASAEIRRIRKSLGLTQEEFAKKLYKSQQAINGYEAGSRQPTLDVLIDISNVFGVSFKIDKGLYTEKESAVLMNREVEVDSEVKNICIENSSSGGQNVKRNKVREAVVGLIKKYRLSNDYILDECTGRGFVGIEDVIEEYSESFDCSMEDIKARLKNVAVLNWGDELGIHQKIKDSYNIVAYIKKENPLTIEIMDTYLEGKESSHYKDETDFYTNIKCGELWLLRTEQDIYTMNEDSFKDMLNWFYEEAGKERKKFLVELLKIDGIDTLNVSLDPNFTNDLED